MKNSSPLERWTAKKYGIKTYDSIKKATANLIKQYLDQLVYNRWAYNKKYYSSN